MSFSSFNADIYSVLNAMYTTSAAQKTAMLRLSTGKRINSASDDPAGLIAISQLNSELATIQAASENATRANAVLDTADAALEEVSTLVTTIKGLTVELANDSALTDAEKQAKQLSIDQAVASIDRLIGTTTFNGKQLLDGTYEITTTGVDGSKITDVDITSRSIATSTPVTVSIQDVAARGEITYSAATVTSALQLTVTGNLGSVTLSFASGSTIASVASSINANTTGTGMSAIASSNNVLYMRSEHYGEDEFVSVSVVSGSFATTGGTTSDYGDDAEVTVNGQTAGVNGLDVLFNVGGATGTFTMSESFATTASGSEAFTIGGGGATFSLTQNASNTFTIGISSLRTTGLGNGTLGYLSQITASGSHNALDNAGLAGRIADEAANQVARARANIGAFQSYTVTSMQNMLSDAEESVTSAISSIEDTDYALETANLTRQNLLMQAQVSAMSLLGQQQSSLIGLLSGL